MEKLLNAVNEGDIETVRVLLESGVDVNCRDNEDAVECAPLHIAVQNENFEMVKILLDANEIDVNIKEPSGSTALHDAAYQNNLEIIKLLLSRGADVNVRDKYGETPLHSVASGCRNNSHLEAAKILLAHQANVIIRNANGETPLHLLTKNVRDNNEIMKLFIDYGGNLSVKNNKNCETPAQLSVIENFSKRRIIEHTDNLKALNENQEKANFDLGENLKKIREEVKNLANRYHEDHLKRLQKMKEDLKNEEIRNAENSEKFKKIIQDLKNLEKNI